MDIRSRRKPLALPAPCVMGIINATPDSFYEGSRSAVADDAVERSLSMLTDGAAIIDIGGESTGPTSADIPAAEELRRILPIVEELRRRSRDCRISIDTWKADVAEEALAAGADIVNDVTAGRGDDRMFPVLAKAGCLCVLMFSKDPSARTTISAVRYDDVHATIHAFFEERLEAARQAGVRKEQIILDPGLGHFISSDPAFSWQILEGLEAFADFGLPILVSPSRKSFTAENPQQPPSERLPGTLRATRIALGNGAQIIRTHDVKETCEMINNGI